MNVLRKNSRIKVPDRIAAMAAVLLLVSSLAGPQALKPATGQDPSLGAGIMASTASEMKSTETETVVMSTPARKSRSFDISSLIFRF
jgi:hypothetical protein